MRQIIARKGILIVFTQKTFEGKVAKDDNISHFTIYLKLLRKCKETVVVLKIILVRRQNALFHEGKR